MRDGRHGLEDHEEVRGHIELLVGLPIYYYMTDCVYELVA